MCQLKVCLLGQFRVQYEQEPPIRFGSSKEQELLGYLMLRSDRIHGREFLAAVLWGESTSVRSRKNLRTALWRLRIDTGVRDGGCPLLTTTKESIQLNPKADIWSDVAVLESTYGLVRGKPADGLTCQEAALLDEAISLYKGVLLEGWYHDWCEGERDRLRKLFLTLADKLMAYYEVQGHYDAGITLGLRVIDEEPTHECTHRRLMRLYCHAGDRVSALQQFARCESILRDTLGLEPSAETRALNHQLGVGLLAPPVAEKPPCERSGLGRILQRVDQLRQQLDELRGEIEQELGASQKISAEK